MGGEGGREHIDWEENVMEWGSWLIVGEGKGGMGRGPPGKHQHTWGLCCESNEFPLSAW